MSQREYAKRRGVSQAAVSRAIRSGRLVRSVTPSGGIADAELADREWDANTDLTEAPAYVRERAAARAATAVPAPSEPVPVEPQPGGTLSENNAAKAYWQARMAKLDYLEAAKELVPAADVDAKLRAVFHVSRTKLLTLPSRAKTLLGLTPQQVARLDDLTRELLEDLAAEGERC